MTTGSGTFAAVGSTPGTLPVNAKVVQIFCTAREVNIDLGLDTDESRLYTAILEASATIQARMGYFIPVTETRLYTGDRRDELMIAPTISVSAVKDDGIELTLTTDYILRNLTHKNPLWANGPYICLERENVGWSHDVEVTGQCSKWSETQPLDETVNQGTDTTPTIAVTDGSKLSPGMVLMVGDEQELVTGFSTPTEITSKINMTAGLTESDEEMTIDTGGDLKEGEVILIGTEKMLVLMVSGNVVVLKRGWANTRVATHANESVILVYRTYTVERGVNGTTATDHGDVAAYRYVVPRDVRELCKQIAALIKRKADAGYAGKQGSADEGIYYYNEFPRTQMAEVESHYKIW